MKWDLILEAILTQCAADSVLVGIFGASNIRQSGSKNRAVPGLEIGLVGDGVSELWEPVTIQFDCWATSQGSARAAERRLRILYHQDLPIQFGSMGTFCQYLDGGLLSSPDRDDVFGRAIRFRFTSLLFRFEPHPTL